MILELEILPFAPPPVLAVEVVGSPQPIQAIEVERQGPPGGQGPPGPGLPEDTSVERVGEYLQWTLPGGDVRHQRLLSGPAPTP